MYLYHIHLPVHMKCGTNGKDFHKICYRRLALNSVILISFYNNDGNPTITFLTYKPSYSDEIQYSTPIVKIIKWIRSPVTEVCQCYLGPWAYMHHICFLDTFGLIWLYPGCSVCNIQWCITLMFITLIQTSKRTRNNE
jgi:hypothetical protein